MIFPDWRFSREVDMFNRELTTDYRRKMSISNVQYDIFKSNLNMYIILYALVIHN